MDADRTTVRHDLDTAVVTFTRHDDNGESRKTGQDSAVLGCRRNRQDFDRAHVRFIAANVPR